MTVLTNAMPSTDDSVAPSPTDDSRPILANDDNFIEHKTEQPESTWPDWDRFHFWLNFIKGDPEDEQHSASTKWFRVVQAVGHSLGQPWRRNWREWRRSQEPMGAPGPGSTTGSQTQ